MTCVHLPSGSWPLCWSVEGLQDSLHRSLASLALTPLVFQDTFSKSQLSWPTSSALQPRESLLSPVQHCPFNWCIIMPLFSLILSHL